jgi:acetyltransferase
MGGSVEGFVVQEMVEGGTELLAGISRNPDFGALIGFGAGGVDAELLRDVAFRLAPLSASDADEMVCGLRSQRLLDGFRGRPPVDRVAAAETMLRLGALAGDVPELVELDLNPLVGTARHGLVALDARARLRVPERA